MATPCVTIAEDASVEECVLLMEKNVIRRVRVVDRDGRCCGIVSQANLATTVDQVGAEVLRHVSQPIPEPSLVKFDVRAASALPVQRRFTISAMLWACRLSE